MIIQRFGNQFEESLWEQQSLLIQKNPYKFGYQRKDEIVLSMKKKEREFGKEKLYLDMAC